MKTVSIHDAKTNLSKYIAAAKRGETIYVGSFGKPEVKLVLLNPNEIKKPKRQFGVLKGKISVPDLEAIDNSPEWKEVIRSMTEDPLHHE